MVKLNLTNTVIEILKENSDKSFTARELAEKVFQKSLKNVSLKLSGHIWKMKINSLLN